MLESRNMQTTFTLKDGVKPEIFQMFLKYLYYDQSAFPSQTNDSASMTMDETLYLIECTEFYGLANDRLKNLSE